MRVNQGRSVKTTKPIDCCSIPEPQEVDLSVSISMCGGTRNSRAISEIWNLRDSRNCASSGGIVNCWNFAPESRMSVECADSRPARFSRHRFARASACGSVSRASVCSTPVANEPEPNSFAPNFSAASASPKPCRAARIGETPHVPS